MRPPYIYSEVTDGDVELGNLKTGFSLISTFPFAFSRTEPLEDHEPSRGFWKSDFEVSQSWIKFLEVKLYKNAEEVEVVTLFQANKKYSESDRTQRGIQHISQLTIG